MKRTVFSGMMFMFLLTSTLTLAFNIQPADAEPKTWTVDDDGPADFHTIQEAVNSPLVADGDTIFVYSGTYYEHVVLNKTLSLTGEDRDSTILNGGGSNQPVVSVLANDSCVDCFTITAGSTGISVGYSYEKIACRNMIVDNLITDVDLGIYMETESSNNTISMNTIEANGVGIELDIASNNTLFGNNIIGNDAYNGILGWAASDSNISRNRIRNFRHGITLYSGPPAGGISENNVLMENDIADCEYGIYFEGSWNNDIIGNTVSAIQHDGISLVAATGSHYYYVPSTNNTVSNNSINSSYYGIFIAGSWNNEVVNNIIKDNVCGVSLCWVDNVNDAIYYSHDNKIVGNNVAENTLNGIELMNASDNSIFHNNFIGNGGQTHAENCTNTWDNGYPSGGNYWSDYSDVDEYSGQDQDQPGSDNIWDQPYVIDLDNRDRYPLVNKWSIADVNHDGVVNVLDLATISAHWYPGPPIGPLGYDLNFDINGDGAINILDAAIVSAYWTGPPKGPLTP